MNNTNITNFIITNNDSDDKLLVILSICSSIGGCSLLLMSCCRRSSYNVNNDKNKNDDGDKIWTSYDEEDKKHWLTVAWGGRRERFLLQDNLMPLWNSNRRSLPERVHFSVDEMIRVIEQMEVLEQRR